MNNRCNNIGKYESVLLYYSSFHMNYIFYSYVDIIIYSEETIAPGFAHFSTYLLTTHNLKLVDISNFFNGFDLTANTLYEFETLTLFSLLQLNYYFLLYIFKSC